MMSDYDITTLNILNTGINCAFVQRDSARDKSPPQRMKVAPRRHSWRQSEGVAVAPWRQLSRTEQVASAPRIKR